MFFIAIIILQLLLPNSPVKRQHVRAKPACCFLHDILEPLRRGTAEIIYTENDGVVIYEQNSQEYMILMRNLEKYRLFAVHQENILKT